MNGRLRPMGQDGLAVYGLPSKGDNRLLDPHLQESYYRLILAAAPDPTALQTLSQHRVDALLLAMRKLREGLLASGRRDAFAHTAYLFIARAGIVREQPSTYRPALAHLLLHGEFSSAGEIRSYRVLDLIGQDALAQARESLHRWQLCSLAPLCTAVVLGNWHEFWRERACLTELQQRLLRPVCVRVRRHVLDCLRVSYLNVECEYVEAALALPSADMRELLDAWTVEQGRVWFRPHAIQKHDKHDDGSPSTISTICYTKARQT